MNVLCRFNQLHWLFTTCMMDRILQLDVEASRTRHLEPWVLTRIWKAAKWQRGNTDLFWLRNGEPKCVTGLQTLMMYCPVRKGKMVLYDPQPDMPPYPTPPEIKSWQMLWGGGLGVGGGYKETFLTATHKPFFYLNWRAPIICAQGLWVHQGKCVPVYVRGESDRDGGRRGREQGREEGREGERRWDELQPGVSRCHGIPSGDSIAVHQRCSCGARK